MKIEADADIMVREHHNKFGQLERRDIWWEGGKIAFIRNTHMDGLYRELECGQVIRLGGLRLKVISRGGRWEPDKYYVMRAGWLAWLYYWLVRGTWWVELAYRRLILTAVVWELAEYERGRLPSWRDLRLRGR